MSQKISDTQAEMVGEALEKQYATNASKRRTEFLAKSNGSDAVTIMMKTIL